MLSAAANTKSPLDSDALAPESAEDSARGGGHQSGQRSGHDGHQSGRHDGHRTGHRALHPVAWWMWALGIAVATTRSPGLVSSALLIAAIITVVALCHHPSAFSRAFPAYLMLAAGVVIFRVIFYVLVGVKTGSDVLIPLPSIALPEWAAGIELLGPITVSGLLAAITSGLALAALLLCFGAAVALTNPQRTLRSLPASLHLLGTPAVIAMTVAPQLVESWQRVRRAQALRGRTLRGPKAVAATTLPVLQDALERSVALAASMDSRGYARIYRGSGRLVGALLLTALLGAAIGGYAILDGTGPRWLALPLFVLGGGAALLGSILASRTVATTRYRPDVWRTRDRIVGALGVVIAALAVGMPLLGSPGAQVGASGWSITFAVCSLLAVSPAIIGRAR